MQKINASFLKNIKSLLGILLASILLTSCKKSSNSQSFPQTVKSKPKYQVTKEMSQELSLLIGKKAPEISSFVHQSKLKTIKNSPVKVIIATKYDCPCQVHAQPLFIDLANKFYPKVSFIGLINTDKELAKEYYHDYIKTKHDNYCMATDENCSILNHLEAKHSVYTYVINNEGIISHAWPGYSKDMLIELNDALSSLTGDKLTPFDTKYAPKKMTSGCVMEPHNEEEDDDDDE